MSELISKLLSKRLEKFWALTIVSAGSVLWVERALAATSAVNNNVRIWEDATWFLAFILMIVTGWTLRKSGGKDIANAYTILAVAGLSGALWKGIGIVKRVLLIEEPEWFFDIVRETFESLTGVFIAISFLTIVIAVRKLYASN